VGSDDLFKKGKARKEAEHQRKMARRAPYDRVLIVCEGTKTEPHYFDWIRTKLRLNRANVVIADKKTGLDPKSLVEYALEEFRRDRDFNRIYCVFDRDKHTTYQATLDKVRGVRLLRGARILAAPSVPAFEIWLLLHFVYTTRQFEVPLEASNCDVVITELKKHIPDYEKGRKDFLPYLEGKTDLEHAKRLEEFHQTSGTDNPSTKVHELIEYLKGLNSRWDDGR
jgi:hypothetical protein